MYGDRFQHLGHTAHTDLSISNSCPMLCTSCSRRWRSTGARTQAPCPPIHMHLACNWAVGRSGRVSAGRAFVSSILMLLLRHSQPVVHLPPSPALSGHCGCGIPTHAAESQEPGPYCTSCSNFSIKFRLMLSTSLRKPQETCLCLHLMFCRSRPGVCRTDIQTKSMLASGTREAPEKSICSILVPPVLSCTLTYSRQES